MDAVCAAEPHAARVERFRDVAREQLPRLYRIARRIVGDEAEDAVQDCLLKGYQSVDQLRDDTAAPAWLVRILVNCCRDRLRRRARSQEDVELDALEEFSLYRTIAYEDPFPYSDSLHLDFLAEFSVDDVRQVLLRLPEHYRIPVVLVYMHGFLAREVAEMLDAPLGTVLARLHRGRKAFEQQMWRYATEHGLLREGVR
ncbi:MAG: sigma-70 family RNA polymerase sigma factor [Actinophytocola sp.]|nr:sigma-70 family RNA polymerase sigma factor [Actinophytocola sp.]